jgi:hypothetical protein
LKTKSKKRETISNDDIGRGNETKKKYLTPVNFSNL